MEGGTGGAEEGAAEETTRIEEDGDQKGDGHSIKVLYTNANGLRSKLSELKLCIDSNNIDIVCITETYFTDSLQKAEVNITGFTPFNILLIPYRKLK